MCYKIHINKDELFYTTENFQLKDASYTDGIEDNEMHISEFDEEQLDGSTIKKKYMPALMYLTSSAGYKSILQLNFLLLIADPIEDKKSNAPKPQIQPLTYPHEGGETKPFDFDIKFLQKCFEVRVGKDGQLNNIVTYNNAINNLIKNHFPNYRKVLQMMPVVNLKRKPIGGIPTTPQKSLRKTRSSTTDTLLGNIDNAYPQFKEFSQSLNSITRRKKLKGMKSNEFKRLLSDNIDQSSRRLFKTSDTTLVEKESEKKSLHKLYLKVNTLKSNKHPLIKNLTEDEYKLVGKQRNTENFFKKRIASIDQEIKNREEDIVDEMTANGMMVSVAKPIFKIMEENFNKIKKFKDQNGCIAMSRVTYEKIMWENLSPDEMEDIEDNQVVELDISQEEIKVNEENESVESADKEDINNIV